MSAIANWADSRALGPLPRNKLYDAVRAGLDNYYGEHNSPQRKTAITIDELCSLRSHLQLNEFKDARDWCAYLFAFFGLLRIEEYSGGSLSVCSVKQESWGVSLTIPFSKTSLVPTSVELVRRDDQLCPLAAYLSYISLIPTSLRLPHLPFFLTKPNSPSPMIDSEFIKRFRTLIRTSLPASPDPDSYAGHSFRRGGTTAMFLAGVPEATIASHGRWRSLAYRSYFDSERNLHLRLMATAQLRVRSALHQ